MISVLLAVGALCGALAGVLLGGGVMYAVLRSRGACEVAESAEGSAEEAASGLAVQAVKTDALAKRLHATERAVDELCRMTNFGVKRREKESGGS